MIKLVTLTVSALMFAAPVFAMDMKCDDASLSKMATDVGALTDTSKRDAGLKDLQIARASMKANNMDDCTKHMNDASKAML
jgi:hypothetical protein